MCLRKLGTFIIFYLLMVGTISSQSAYYWVGGSGEWNDRNHWSFNSGGAGGAGIPDNTINAFFDENSFNGPGQVVTVSTNLFKAACRDLNWLRVTNNPTFEIIDPTISLSINGSLRLSSDMTWNVQIPVNMTARTSGHEIISSGQQFLDHLVFDGFNGEWTINDRLDVGGSIIIESGSFVSNDVLVFAMGFIADSGLDVTIDLGKSNLVIIAPNPAPALFVLEGDFIELIANESTISLLGEKGIVRLNADVPLSFGKLEFTTEDATLTTTNIPGQLLPFFNELEFAGNGLIEGNHVIVSLTLSNAKTVFLKNGSRQIIDMLKAVGSACDGDAGLMASFGSNVQATIDFGRRNSFVGPFNLRGIAGISTGGAITMVDGINSGNNSINFKFTVTIPRTVYWVGGSGRWDDPSHWSTRSGGPGGACIPRSLDDVVFDNLSFPGGLPNPQVISTVPIFINSFTFTTTAGSGMVPSITIPSLYITEDLTITKEVFWNINNVYLIGLNVGGATGNTDNQNINVIPGILRNLIIRGEAGTKVILNNHLNVQGNLDIGGDGSFQSQGYNLTAQTIRALDTNVLINLDNSTIRVTGSIVGTVYPLTIRNIISYSGRGTQWVFSSSASGFDIDMVTDFGSVTFSNSAGNSRLLVRESLGINTLDIMNNGDFEGLAFSVDSLIFHPGPSRTYVINPGVDLMIQSYFEGLNDLCNDLTITTPNTQERITMDPGIELLFSFVTIDNVSALGGGDFFAGEGSTRVGTANGWRFATAADNLSAQQFLGNDITACGDSLITLMTPDQLVNVVWIVNGANAATGQTYALTGNETNIIAEAETMTGCPISDTIEVALSQPFSIELGLPRNVCQGASELLDPGFSDPSATYLWNTGQDTETISVNTTDTYSLTVTRAACTEVDAVTITRIDLPPFDLGNDITACADSLITLMAPDQLVNVVWVVNGANTATGQTYSLTGNETNIISEAQTMTGCPISDTIEVALSQPFSIELGLPRDLCQGASELLDPGFSDPSATYLWNTGQDTETISVNTTDTYTLTVTRAACTEVDAVTITRIDLEPFGLGNDTTLCQMESFTIPDPGFVRNSTTFQWNNGNTSGPLEISETTLPPDNIYYIEVSEGQCSDSDSIRVTFDTAISQVLTANTDTTLCEGDQFIMKVLPGFDSVRWSTQATSVSIPVDEQGLYSVEAFRGVCRQSEQRNVRVSTIPSFELGASVTICENQEVQLFKPSNISHPIVWIEAATETALSSQDTFDVQKVIGATTEYILEVQDGICIKRDSISVTVEVAPLIELGRDTTLCQGASVSLSLPADLDNYIWSNNESSLTNVISTSGEISVIADRGRCIVYDTINIGVLDLTALDIGPRDTVLCAGDLLTLNATLPGSVNYAWSPVNAGPTYNVFVADEYMVTVSASGCEVSDTINVRFDNPATFDLHQMPGATDSIICAGETIEYNFNIAGASYLWQNFNQNDLGTQGSFNITEEGGYTLDVTIGACRTTDSIIVRIQELPELSLQDSVTACEGEIISLDATTPNGTYMWNTNATTPVLNVIQTGMYSVIATANKCSNSDMTYVTFNTLPNASLPADQSLCDGDSLALTLNDINVSYNWESPIGTLTTNSVIANTQGAYIVQVTNPQNCIAIDTFVLTINPTPFFELPDSTSLCDGNAVTLTVNATSTPTRYRWSNADGNPSIEARTEGTYYADAFIMTGGIECKWSDTTFVMVRPIPVADIGEDAIICSDSILTLNATLPGASYLWSTNETTPTIQVSDNGSYNVTIDVNGCTDEDVVLVTTIPVPVVNLGMDTTICDGDVVTLTAGVTSGTISWSTGATSPAINVSQGATYSVKVADNGCETEDDVVVNIEPNPIFDLGEDISICDQIGVSLNVTIPNVSVQWSTGETGPVITATQTGLISATATSAIGCTYVDEIDISRRECVRFSVYRPNVFAPNGSQTVGNEVFMVTPATTAIISSYTINIFNRWGSLMYTSNDYTVGWNGRDGSNGRLMNPGVYTYVIEIIYSDDFDTNRRDVLHGSVTLID